MTIDGREALLGGVLIAGLCVVGMVGVWAWGQSRPAYNPAIWDAVRAEELACMKQTSPRTRTIQCDELLRFITQCGPSDCTIDETYALMTKLGFSLPPLRITPAGTRS